MVLGVSEFMATFELTPPGGEPLERVTAADQHSYALLMLADLRRRLDDARRRHRPAPLRLRLRRLRHRGAAALPDHRPARRRQARHPRRRLGVHASRPPRPSRRPASCSRRSAAVVLGLAAVAFATLRSHQLQAPLALVRARRRPEEDAGAIDRPSPQRPKRSGAKPPPQPAGRRRSRASPRIWRGAESRSRTQEAKRPAGREPTRTPSRALRGPPSTSGSGRRPCWPGPCGRCRPCA